MTRLIAALLLLLVAQPDALVGQNAVPDASLVPGARVRITSRDDEKPRVATVVSRTTDTLRVRMAGVATTVAMPLAGISRIDVNTGQHRNVFKGMLFGTLGGGTMGAILGAASYEPCESKELLGCLLASDSQSDAATIGGVAGGALGLIVGSVLGMVSHDTWRQVPLDERRVTVDIKPRAQGAGLGVALKF